MLVKYWMRKAVITASVEDSMQEVMGRMKEYFLNLVPVMKGANLVGVITDSDIKRASASDATLLDVHELIYLLGRVKAKNIMTTPVIIVPPDFTLEETADLLLKNNISGAPVVDKKERILGTIGQRDIFRALVGLTGFKKRGFHIAVCIPDQPGEIKKITDIIVDHGGRLAGIITSYERAPAGKRNLYVRTYSLERPQMDVIIDKISQVGDLLYMVDHKTDERRIFAESGMPAISAETWPHLNEPRFNKTAQV